MARLFDASTERVDFGTAHGSDSIPLSCWAWVYQDSTPGASTQILGRNNNAATDFWWLSVTTANALRIRVSFSGGTAFAHTADSTMTNGVWQFVAGVVSASTIAIYRGTTPDGVADATSTSTAPSGSHTSASLSFYIGNWSDNNRHYPGKIAEAGFIYGTALTLQQLKAIAAFGWRGLPDQYTGYFPLWGDHDPEIDLTGTTTGTVTGATKANHAPVTLFVPRWLGQSQNPDAVITPARQDAVWAIQAPAVTISVTVEPARQNATWAIQTPTIANVITPSRLDATWAIQTPSLQYGVVIEPARQNTTWAIQTPTVVIPATVTPSRLDAVWAAQAPTITFTTPVVVTPARQNLTWAIQTPGIYLPSAPVLGGYAGASGPRYEIWWGNDAGVRQALISQVSSFEYFKVLNDIGYFSLRVPLSFNRSLIRRDARIEIWRAYPGGALTLDFLGFLRKYRYATDARGVTTIELSGPDLNHLIWRRQVLYAAGSSQAVASAEYADNLCKRLMRENHGSSATAARNWTSLGLSVAANLSAAQQVTLSFHYENVLKVCKEAAETSRQKGTPLYFGAVPLSPTSFEFQTKITTWGFDRTAAGLQGTLGLEFGNLAEPELEIDWWDEITHVTAGGQGDKAARTTRTAEDTARSGASLWNRIEGFKDARGETTGDGVQDAAKADLERGRPHRRFRGRIVQTKGFIYGRDWGLGDNLPWTYFQQGEGIVRSVRVSVDGTGKETIDSRLETEE